MKPVLPLFIFIDACGWEIIRHDPFATLMAPHRKRLESVFGYSSACVPSILSGRWPAEHRNWCYFVYDPDHSPFRSLDKLKWLPKFITSRRRFRHRLSRLLKPRLNFRGYFDLYNLPFEHLSLFDFTEKKSPLQPGGMNQGANIFDFLEGRGIPYHVSEPEKGEAQNLEDLRRCVIREAIDFAFVYWPALDGLLHRVGNKSPEIGPKLRQYEEWIGRLLATAREHYAQVRLYIFSDHGMANCDELLDLKSTIQALPLRFGEDYAAVYDSTMARFWLFEPRARQLIIQALKLIPQGRIVSDAELEQWHCRFPDRYFGEVIFLVQEGVLIVPSDMGERPIRAMHGYDPASRHSHAALATNQPEIPEDIAAIPDIFKLMQRDAELAKELNQSRPSVALRRQPQAECWQTSQRVFGGAWP